MPAMHTVRSYDEALDHLNDLITKMAQLVQDQLQKAVISVKNSDINIAQEVIDKDPEIDSLETEIDAFAIRTIALRQPVAGDLRNVIAALKISSHLERIADYASNISRRVIALQENSTKNGISITMIPRMSEVAVHMIRDVLHAYTHRDDQIALEVWQRDVEIDEMYNSYLRELLTYMMEDPRNISPCTQLLFISKHIERIGDHVTNIAEAVHYMVHGEPFQQPRPRG